MPADSLVVIETHPVQYHAPVYRTLQARFGIPVTVIYGSDFSVAGYQDREFDATFAWDTDLLSGYQSVFLSRASAGGSRSFEEVSAAGLRKALRTLNPGSILLLGYSPRFHQSAILQAWQTGRPILFRAETTDHACRRNNLQASVRNQALRWLYGSCAKLLYVGHHSEQHFRRLGAQENQLVFSPYCVDTTPFQADEADRELLRSAARRHLNIGREDMVLLFSGKLTARKGVDLLVAAVKTLPADIRGKMVVVFLGGGELQESLTRLTASAPEVNARFPGFENQTRLSPYYHAADLLVLPSHRSETWGLVVNEALHHGLPCVVSDAVGCTPDLVEPGITGEIFETGSIQQLAATLLRAMALVGRVGIREQCRSKVSGYTVENAAEGIARAYRAVVN